MTPVDQRVTHPERGDCMRATVASMFDLELDQVPHFRLFNDDWWSVYCGFIWGLGYDVVGTGYFPKHTPRSEHLKDCHVGGYVDACVPSKNYPKEMNIYHAVVMDLDGVVVHDPHPSKSWQGINVIESGDLDNWILIKKRVIND